MWVLDVNPVLAARIITSPSLAKRLHEALGKNIEKFEKRFGRIETKVPE